MEAEQIWIHGINTDKKLALEQWIEETRINLVQVNGQRKYGGPPPGWIGETPGNGTEVYIGKIPQNIYEDTLIPLFQGIGKLYEFRLMMTFSGLNRGFAYARYASRRKARTATTLLNGFQISPGSKIAVSRSTEKCELLLSRIPHFLDQAALKMAVQEITLGVEGLLLFENPVKGNEMMAVVTYNSHRAAAMAKKKLRQEPQTIGGQYVGVDWLNAEVRYTLQTKRPKPDTNVSFAIKKVNTYNGLLKSPGVEEPRSLFQGPSQKTKSPSYFMPPHTSNKSYLNNTTGAENKKLLASPRLPSLNQSDRALSEHHEEKWSDELEMDENLWNMEQILQSLLGS
uniref:RRM domain-containing protein n=1 Tax=Leptobrachium leishanense TaxID=445787 RepID=A0A8C5MBT5_9ANUR